MHREYLQRGMGTSIRSLPLQLKPLCFQMCENATAQVSNKCMNLEKDSRGDIIWTGSSATSKQRYIIASFTLPNLRIPQPVNISLVKSFISFFFSFQQSEL